MLYNPFGLGYDARSSHNIGTPLLKNPRRITIVYHNALLEAVLDEQNWLKKHSCFSLGNGARVSIWRNRLEANPVSASGTCPPCLRAPANLKENPILPKHGGPEAVVRTR